MTITPDQLFSLANGLALLGWALLGLAPRWRGTQRLVLSGAWPLGLAALYAVLRSYPNRGCVSSKKTLVPGDAGASKMEHS